MAQLLGNVCNWRNMTIWALVDDEDEAKDY